MVFFEPKPGDGDDFVAIETEQHGRFALTTTCAANAAGLTSPEMHCYAPAEAARAAFAPLAAKMGKDVVSLAKEVLASAAGKVMPTIRSLIKDYQLEEEQQVLIGTGGGIGALLPTVAEGLSLRFEIAKDAEIISSIGAALAMVREVVERANPDPSSDDIVASSRRSVGGDRQVRGPTRKRSTYQWRSTGKPAGSARSQPAPRRCAVPETPRRSRNARPGGVAARSFPAGRRRR